MRSSLTLAAALALAAVTASAHVIVEPERTLTGRTQVYTVIVPAEHATSPTVEVTLAIPLGVEILSVEESPGWRFTLFRDAPVGGTLHLKWSGGRVSPNRFVRFGFAAQNPGVPRKLVWRATQRYADGSVDHWDDPESLKRTASVTRVVLPDSGPRGDRPAVALAAAALGLALLALLVALVSWRRRVSRSGT